MHLLRRLPRLWICFLASAAMAAAAGAPEPRDVETIKSAERVAKNFLASIDAGNAGGAEKLVYVRENRAATSGRVARNPIVSTHGEIEQRKRFGRLKSRTLVNTEILRDVSGFPTGRFVRFTYKVRYEKKDVDQTESLTIKADNPQRWKVVAF